MNDKQTLTGLVALWERCRRQPRYWLILAVVIVIALYGRASTPKTVQYPAGYANPLWTSDRSLAVGQVEQRFSDVLSSAAGDYWKVFITARADLSEPDRSGLPGPTSEMLSVWLRSPNGSEQSVGSFEAPVSKDYSTYEFTVKTTTNFRDLVVKREDAESRALVMINNPQIVRLNVTSDAELNGLRPSVIGSTKISVASAQVNTENDLALARVGEPEQRVGQIFQAKSSLLTGIGLKLQRSGNGGLGTYLLGIYEVDLTDGLYKVSSSPIASLTFSADGAFKYYVQQPGGYEIHFPILANLTVDHYYFAALSAVDLRSGTLNSLSLVGDTAALPDVDWPALRVVDGRSTIFGQAYLQAYTAEVSSQADAIWPGGVRVVDLGQGEGLYSYQKNNCLLGALNLTNLAGVANKIAVDNFNAPTNVPLDQELLYEFETIYAFKAMHFRISPLSSDPQKVNVGLYYSFDKQDWRLLEADQTSSSEGVLDQTIAGDGRQHRVYIKAVGNAPSPITDGWFGLGEIQVTAGLQIR